jgi:hypothetical protein
MAMAALAISSRSMVAISRLNNEAEGARPKEAVLDILFPIAVQWIAGVCSEP